MVRTRTVLVTVLILLFASVSLAAAQAPPEKQKRREFEGVGIDAKHGQTIPKDLVFRNSEGDPVSLEQYFDGEKPVIINFLYHECPMLCGLMLNGMTSTLSEMSWTPGEEFRVLSISFNHRETSSVAREAKETYIKQLGKPDAADGWHFLTGSKASIDALTSSTGFQFRWVEEQQEYAHPTAWVFLSGNGKITQYIYGMEPKAGDVRKALVEASDGSVGNPLDQVAMYCFQFDPEANTYTADAFNLMKIGSVITVFILGGALFFFWRRENEDLRDMEDRDPLKEIDELEDTGALKERFG
ncbi:electron transporter SenC [Longibacter salinarum]|uniref:Electron transporter SenC n=2 Tax=Longibacter salinarum TaxID=1850348 RepID=A0A2A8D0G5_9BACT|nr:electron transporter SenC [Longibacter salinarum]